MKKDKGPRKYPYGRIHVLSEQLAGAGIAPEVAAQIMAGGEEVRADARPEVKAAWLQGAMERMDNLLAEDTRHGVREQCACCLGGKRLQISRGIAKAHESLEERLRAANDARYVFGHSVPLEEDGRILVRFEEEGKESYRCVCLPKAKGAVSVTYCYCCGGHVKHHLQTALGRQLDLTVRSSALESAGQRPCTFLFRIQE